MFRRRRAANDFSAEIEAHLQLETDRLREQGFSEEEARVAARRAFGNRVRAEERFHESGRWIWWDSFLKDLRFGLRMLGKSRGSTAVAVVTLALGIGANTAIFSLLNAILLRNLPVSHPEQLLLFGKGQWVGSQDTLPNRSWQLFSYPFYREFREKNQVFSDVAAVSSILFGTHGRVVAPGNSAEANLEKIDIELVSGSYFHTLGVSPILGRVLTSAEDNGPGAHPVAVASYSWWQRRFARDPAVLGRTVTVGQTVYSIIGVAPPEFFGVSVGQSPDLWIPLTMEKEISPGWNGLEQNLFQSLYIIARRKSGVSVEEASANTNLLFKQILHEYAGPQPSRNQLEDIQHARIELTSAATGLSQLRQQFSLPLKILMAVVVLVLLIACANVANLLLARGTARQREIAVRMSIGAPRSRLIRQLLIESALLGLIGAVLGVLLAWAANGVFILAAESPITVTPDTKVLGFTLAITMLTVLLFGTAPAFSATRLELVPSLKEGRATASLIRNRLARFLVLGQVALSLVLLAGAGLFLRSLANLMNVDTGFDKQNVLAMGIDPEGYKLDARLESMMERVEERVASIPGIHGASFAFFVFDAGEWTTYITVPGRHKSDQDREVDHNLVGPQYLDVMKMPIVLGRGLDPRDNWAARKVAVINETMAHLYFPGASPLGRTFSVGDEAEWQNVGVVGVVKDAKYVDLEEKQMPAAFYPHAQHRGVYLYTFVARYTGDRKALIPLIRNAVREVDPNLVVSDPTTLVQLVDHSVRNKRLVAQLSTFFGILAAFLACIGIYGVMSYGVGRRSNEFGIRMALGAERQDVLWVVLREALVLALTGVAIGLALALAASRLIQNFLFGVKSADPVALGVAMLAMIMVALLAGYLPARRATRIDPMVALRYE